MRDALVFYRCGSVTGFREHFETTRADFRKSKVFRADPHEAATWLRRCEQEAGRLDMAEFSPESLVSTMQELRRCTLLPLVEGLEAARALLPRSGVALVWVEPLPKSRLSGAAFALPDRRVVAITLRHGSDDHVWFTIFHELGHVLLHGGRETFVDDHRGHADAREQEADAFAREQLIPAAQWAAFVERRRFLARHALEFARAVDVSPGIVVGFLQHDARVQHSALNGLKRWVTWDEGMVRAR